MFLTCLFAFFLLGILTKSSLSVAYASQGIQLWLNSMLPALLPFMILSGIMIRTNMAQKLAKFFSPLLGPLLRCSDSACFTVVIGFLCGFPLGAKTVSDLYDRGHLEFKEARWLLAFCNNIGPAFFMGFVLPLLHAAHPLYCVAGFYGIPFLYGLLLRFVPRYHNSRIERSSFITKAPEAVSDTSGLVNALQDAVSGSMLTMLNLGGYMILFNLLNLLPHWIMGSPVPLLGPLFEITSGLRSLNGTHPLYCMTALTFGGLSCLAQTLSCLKAPELKQCMGEYLLHKCILSLLVLLYFICISTILPPFWG